MKTTLVCLILVGAAMAQDAKHPISLDITEVSHQVSGATVQHGAKPAFCNNPQNAYEQGFCSTYNPSDTITRTTSLMLSASAENMEYTLRCHCKFLEPGKYSARRKGGKLLIVGHGNDKEVTADVVSEKLTSSLK